MNDKKKPAHEIRLGRNKAVIWSNENENGEQFSVQLKRLYRLPGSEQVRKTPVGEKRTQWVEMTCCSWQKLLTWLTQRLSQTA